MEIIVEPRAAAPAMPRFRKSEDLGGRRDLMLRSLVRAGMSEQVAREQLARLWAGDVWSG